MGTNFVVRVMNGLSGSCNTDSKGQKAVENFRNPHWMEEPG
jgi:hypothetical protein